MDSTRLTPWFHDARNRRALELLGILWLLAMADLLFTLWAHLYTPFHELNPWAGALLAHHKLAALAVMKILLTAGGTAILWRFRKSVSAQIAIWVVVLAYVVLMFRWSDYTTQILGLGIVTS